MLRGVRAAGVALCYGNNNGGDCAAGSAHPLAPNVAQSSPRLFSCPARLSSKPPLLFTHSPSASPPLKLQFLPTFLSFSSPLRLSHFLCPYPDLLFISPPSLSSQFHPFLCHTKTAIHPWHLEANKTSSENAKPAQKCHRSWDFCLKIRSRSPRQSYLVFLIH